MRVKRFISYTKQSGISRFVLLNEPAPIDRFFRDVQRIGVLKESVP